MENYVCQRLRLGEETELCQGQTTFLPAIDMLLSLSSKVKSLLGFVHKDVEIRRQRRQADDCIPKQASGRNHANCPEALTVELQRDIGRIKLRLEHQKSLVNECLIPTQNIVQHYIERLETLRCQCDMDIGRDAEPLSQDLQNDDVSFCIEFTEVDGTGPPLPQTIDWQIEEQGGTTSTIELLPSAVQAEKETIPIEKYNGELQRKMKRLAVENEYYESLVVLALEPLLDISSWRCSQLCTFLHQCKDYMQGLSKAPDLPWYLPSSVYIPETSMSNKVDLSSADVTRTSSEDGQSRSSSYYEDDESQLSSVHLDYFMDETKKADISASEEIVTSEPFNLEALLEAVSPADTTHSFHHASSSNGVRPLDVAAKKRHQTKFNFFFKMLNEIKTVTEQLKVVQLDVAGQMEDAQQRWVIYCAPV